MNQKMLISPVDAKTILVTHPRKPEITFIMDAEDECKLQGWLWVTTSKDKYGILYNKRSTGCYQLTRFIMNTTDTVSYIDGNRFNLCKNNLKISKMSITTVGDYSIATNTNTGFSFLLDTSDVPLLGKQLWCASSGGYAHSQRGLLHRLIMNAPIDKVVDHKNGIVTDNRRSNLRLCYLLNNGRNRKLASNSTSGYTGVTKSSDKKKWVAYIAPHNRIQHLGTFDTKWEAACAYNKAADEYYGEFARLNAYMQHPSCAEGM